MKYLFTIFCLIILCSCTADGTIDTLNPSPSETELDGTCTPPELSNEELLFSSEGGIDSIDMSSAWLKDTYAQNGCISIKNNNKETRKIECPWFSVTQLSDYKLLISVNKNETGQEREQVVSVSGGDCNSIFLVYQSAELDENQLLDADLRVDKEKFISETDIWKSQDIKNYSFTLKKSSITDNYEVAIIVKNGIMDSFEYIGKTSNFEPEYTSISDMYQKIYNEIKYYETQKSETCRSFIQFEMKYDQESHYITNFEAIYAAYVCEGGSHNKFIVSDFTILPP